MHGKCREAAGGSVMARQHQPEQLPHYGKSGTAECLCGRITTALAMKTDQPDKVGCEKCKALLRERGA
jgi:hypothetical protein